MPVTRRARRWIPAAVALCCMTPGAFAKPLFLIVERELDAAVLVAEARVVRVDIADSLGRGGNRGDVVVEVTADPTRIYRGPRYLGRRIRLQPPPAGPRSCTMQLNVLRGGTVLFVADAEHVIRLTGAEAEGDGEDGYRLRGWCDHNACMLRSSSGDLGVGRDGPGGTTYFDVRREKLRARYREECSAFWGLTARFLAGEAPETAPAEIARHIEALGAGDPARREAAQERLVAAGTLHVPLIREAARAATDPEVRRCLEDVVARLREPADAHDAATRLARGPVAARMAAARAGLGGLEGHAATRVREYLARLEAQEG